MNTIVERGKVWEASELPNKSIALDGAVRGPLFDTERQVFSFDHHANCSRHATKSTTLQVFEAIKLGLNPSEYNVYVNDVDGDTVMAVWLLSNPGVVHRESARGLAMVPYKLEALVRAIDILDCHGPAYKFRDKSDENEMADMFYNYVMAPQSIAQANKTYATCDLKELLNKCLVNMSTLYTGHGYELEEYVAPEPEYTVTTQEGFSLVEAKGFVFRELYAKGINAAVVYSLQKDGSYRYTIGKSSEFHNFPVAAVLAKLNEVEPGWGGGSTIGGSPRNEDGSSSRLAPEEVCNIIKEVLL